ncbi:gluconokinase [Glycomyces arizonensis]|uniref:gluconokinase n=1 Tax=Glycomyces arizonensis TaxID=256035 RepID=UPI000425E175|nr:gluconokinase [Glycomyces arizonensis]
MTTTCLVVMGVSGVGKSTIAKRLADRLGWSMAEGDEYHSEANIDKMEMGVPLTDQDRLPWLRDIRDWIGEQDAEGVNTVVTCSALKRSYRDMLREAPARVFFVHLSASPELIASRLSARTGHFMPPRLLDSQFRDLEPLGADEAGMTVDVADLPDHITEKVIEDLRRSGAASA